MILIENDPNHSDSLRIMILIKKSVVKFKEKLGASYGKVVKFSDKQIFSTFAIPYFEYLTRKRKYFRAFAP